MAFDFINTTLTGATIQGLTITGSVTASTVYFQAAPSTYGTPFNSLGEAQTAKNLAGLTGTISGSGLNFSSSLGGLLKIYVVNGIIVSASA